MIAIDACNIAEINSQCIISLASVTVFTFESFKIMSSIQFSNALSSSLISLKTTEKNKVNIVI